MRHGRIAEQRREKRMDEDNKSLTQQAYEYWLDSRFSMEDAVGEFGVTVQEMEAWPNKSKTQQAYEFLVQHHFSMRRVARKFGISHVTIFNYRNIAQGRYSPALKRKLTHNTRNDVKMFHGMRCYVCWKNFEADELDIDYWNGDPTDDSYGNLVPLCKQCHGYKTGHKTIGFTYKFSYGRNIAIIEEDQD